MKKLQKDILGLTGAGLGISIGTGVVESTGTSLGGEAGTAASSGASAMSGMAGYLPPIGSALGGLGAIRILKKGMTKKKMKW